VNRMVKVNLTVNGKKITASKGEKLLWAALDNGIYIPNLCALRDNKKPTAACRLCFVEVQGKDRPVTACTEIVEEGMVVNTRGNEALELARSAFELIMASHSLDCRNCSKNGSCELQVIASCLRVKLKPSNLRSLPVGLIIDDSHPSLTYDPNKCVLCGRCVWVCNKRNNLGILGFAYRGFKRMVTTFEERPLAEFPCQECFECISVCPSGALTLKSISSTESAAVD